MPQGNGASKGKIDPHFKWLAAVFALIVIIFLTVIQSAPKCRTETDAEHVKRITNRNLVASGALMKMLVGDVGPIVCDLHVE